MARIAGNTARSMSDTYFPGYGWRPVECPVCSGHLGWLFDLGSTCRTNEEIGTENAAQVMRRLGKQCLTKSLGYWIVEWCNREYVKQFHVEGHQRRPEYSLGAFSESVASVDSDLEEFQKLPGIPGKRNYHLQRYELGQRCDETNAPRSTRVMAVCCRDHASGVGDLSIVDFREVAVCSYSIILCVPDLCRVKGFSPVIAEQDDCKAVPQGAVDSFVALDWSAVVAEFSKEMEWASSIKPVVGVIPT